MALHILKGCHVLPEIEPFHQRAHLRHEGRMLRMILVDLVELEMNGRDVADLPEIDQLIDILHRRAWIFVRVPGGSFGLARLNRTGLVGPFDLEQLTDQLQQARHVDRLHQVAVVERLRQRCAMGFERARRDHQYAGVVMPGGAEAFSNRPAVGLAHRDVEQEHVRLTMLREIETGRAVWRTENDEAERSEDFAQEIAVSRIVVGDENGLARAVIAVDRRVDCLDAGGVCDFRQQHFHLERAAFSDGAGDADVAAHHAGEQLADGEPETRAGLRLRDAERAALERREDAIQIIGMNAGSGVAHFEFSDRAAVMHDEMNAAALGELDGVRQEVDENLPQTLLVGIDHRGQGLRPLKHELDVFGRGLQAEHADKLIEESMEPHFVTRQMKPTGFDLGNIQQAVDQS